MRYLPYQLVQDFFHQQYSIIVGEEANNFLKTSCDFTNRRQHPKLQRRWFLCKAFCFGNAMQISKYVCSYHRKVTITKELVNIFIYLYTLGLQHITTTTTTISNKTIVLGNQNEYTNILMIVLLKLIKMLSWEVLWFGKWSSGCPGTEWLVAYLIRFLQGTVAYLKYFDGNWSRGKLENVCEDMFFF